MNDLFLVCLGGSGSKVMEAVTHMAAMDAWSARNIHALLVDVDGGNGNQDRAQKTVEYYSAIHNLCSPSIYDVVDSELFRTEITLYPWYPTTNGANLATYKKPSENSASAIVSRFLFTESERSMNIDEGFKGHPNLGVLFMQKILDAQEPVAGSALGDFLDAALREKTERTNNGEEMRIFVVGSCFGGTGASCIPVLGRYLRKHLGDDLQMGLLAMLPTFSLRKSESASSIDPDSAVFDNRVKTVLSTYIDQDVLVYHSPQSNLSLQIYDHIYLLGSPELIPYPIYSPGRSTQENPATFFDWFACSAIHHFFESAPDGVGAKNAGPRQSILTAWLEQGPWDWNHIDTSGFPRLQMKATKLMIAIGSYMSEMYKPLTTILKIRERNVDNHLLGYFQKLSASDLHALQDALRPFSEYCALAVLWFFQIATTLPKDMFPDMGIPASSGLPSTEVFETEMNTDNIQQSFRPLLFSLYYQQFFNPVALFHLECLRRTFWPRGNESTEEGVAGTKTLFDAITAIMNDQRGPDEARRLGALLNSVTKSSFYPAATADAIMGRVYANGEYADEPKYAAYTLIRRLFKAIDMMVRR